RCRRVCRHRRYLRDGNRNQKIPGLPGRRPRPADESPGRSRALFLGSCRRGHLAAHRADRPVTSVSIIIVNYNARRHLEDCLTSLADAPPATPHEIVVVDNASTDGSAATVKERWPRVKVIEQPANVGFAAGNNAGIRATAGTLILLLNNDTIVARGAIDALGPRV